MKQNRYIRPSGKPRTPPLDPPPFPHVLVPRLLRVTLGAAGPFDERRIQLSPRLNFIIGEGGSGKSSLIWALMAASRRLPTSERRETVKREWDGTVSAGPLSLLILRRWIDQLTPDRALLFDEDIFGALGLAELEDAFRLISRAQGQVVVALPRRFKIGDLVARKLRGLALVIKRDPEGSGKSSVDAIKLSGKDSVSPRSSC